MAQQARRNQSRKPSHGTGAARREHLRRQRIRQARWRKVRLPLGVGVLAVIAILLVVVTRGGSSSTTTSTSSGDTASSGAPPAAASAFGASTTTTSKDPIDGIPCEAGERLTYHVHAGLTVYVNGEKQTIPANIGINQTNACIYWLHSHDTSGVMHIEAPSQKDFTLGEWFDVWGQPLSASQVATATGAVTAYVDGQPFTGDPRTIPLKDKTSVQLDVGNPAPPAASFEFPGGL